MWAQLRALGWSSPQIAAKWQVTPTSVRLLLKRWGEWRTDFPRVCQYCGKAFDGGLRRRYCQELCRLDALNARLRAAYALHPVRRIPDRPPPTPAVAHALARAQVRRAHWLITGEWRQCWTRIRLPRLPAEDSAPNTHGTRS